MKNIILGIMLGFIVVFIGLYAIDIDVAKNEYIEAKAYKLPEVRDCIFDINCERYNNILKGV